MKILFVSDDFLPAIGGISLMVHGLAEACSALGHDVTVLAPGGGESGNWSRLYRIIRDTRPRPGGGRRYASLVYARHTTRQVRKAVDSVKPDIILLGVYRTYARACLKVGKRFGILVGGLVHGSDELLAFRNRRSLLRALAGRVVGWPTFRQHVLMYLRDADKIFANSSTTAAYVERGSGRRPVVIGCGVPDALVAAAIPSERSSAERRLTRARLGLPDVPTVGFLGRLVVRKNCEAIIRSLSELSDCNALIVGDGPTRGSLDALARELGVSERVSIVGQVDEGLKQEYLRAMDVFCMPSRDINGEDVEGFGIVFLEAAAAGVPVVGGRSGGIPDVVQHERTGLLANPNDWRDVASCLRRMLQDRQLAADCVSAAQARLRDEFNWVAIARRIVSEMSGAGPNRLSGYTGRDRQSTTKV